MSEAGTIFEILLLLQMAEAYFSGVNVALHKRAFYCAMRYQCESVTNGITNDDDGPPMTVKCNFIAFIVINLLEKYSIQYVAITMAWDHPKDLSERLGIYLHEGSFSAYCAEFPVEPTRYIRDHINCAQWPKLFSEVQVNSRLNDGMHISEIEVGTLATGLPHVKHVLLYRGCFKNFGDKAMDYEWNMCYQKCFRYSFIFAGIKENRYCVCGNNLNMKEELSSYKCNLKCNETAGYCGGRDAYSVYVVRVPLPYHVGCYVSYASYIEKAALIADLSIYQCLVTCMDNRYAILQNRSYCICEDENINIEEREQPTKCSMRCAASPYPCGGEYYKSVYSTCKHGVDNSIKCSDFMQCTRKWRNMFGMCSNCKPGFVGNFCISRDETMEYNETIDNFTITDKQDYIHLIKEWIEIHWVYILFVLLTVAGIVICFKSPCRRNKENGLPPSSTTPASKRKADQKVEQQKKKKPTKASTSKKSQPKKSESRIFGKLFRKKKSNVNITAETKAQSSLATETLTKKRKESHRSKLDKAGKRQSMSASQSIKPKQEFPVTGVITKPPGETELPDADAINKPKPVTGTTEHARERKTSMAEQKKKA